MEGLIELIFEGVPDSTLPNLVDSIISDAEVIEISHSDLGGLELDVEDGLMRLMGTESGAVYVSIRVSRILIGGVGISRPLLRVFRFDEANEVAIVFDSVDVDERNNKDTVLRLASGSEALAYRASVPDYYCGFEPATDDQTRLFHGRHLGPLDMI